MKVVSLLCSALVLVLSHTATHAEDLYKWKDARGNTQYGDNPPPNSNAVPIDLPKITVIDNYSEQWKPLNFGETPVKKQAPLKARPASNVYSKLAFLAPKENQAIRANDGDVSAMVSIQPPLKKGHQLTFSIDGKVVKRGAGRIHNFSNLDRGGHKISVSVVDQRGKTIKNSSVAFTVLRANSTNNEKNNKAKQLPKLKSFNEIREKQLEESNQ